MPVSLADGDRHRDNLPPATFPLPPMTPVHHATLLADASVLIIDDVPANIQVLAEALSDDYKVRVATSGAEGLAVAQQNPPDLILLDVMMPSLDGFEVCRQLKADKLTQRIPVIFVTARGGQEDEERGLNLGAVDYVVKPFQMAIVRARVRNHLQLKRRADLLEELAHVDALTGIANRRRFGEAIEVELRRCQRNKIPLSLLMIDIDHFKQYNDHYGHGMGDLCLSRIASTLASNLGRAADLVARYGGEEFAVVLPASDLTGALQIAERLRAAVSAEKIPHAALGAEAHVTLSIGIATVIPDNQTTVLALIEEADKNLYAAKAAGRNRVCSGRA
jgi:diguanylate cyclase (GGDEF)-like protein